MKPSNWAPKRGPPSGYLFILWLLFFFIQIVFRETDSDNLKLKTRLTSFQRSYTYHIRLTCYLFFQKSKNMIKIGIIGGSGFYQLSDLKDSSEKIVDTEFGPPSDKLVEGTIYGVPVVVLARFFKRKFIYSIIFLLWQQSFYISSSFLGRNFRI